MTCCTAVAAGVKKEELVEYIAHAVKNIFTTMIWMDDITEDSVLDEPFTRFSYSISGIVGLGGAYSGMVGVHIPNDFAKEATAAMLGMEADEIENESDIHDAIGEIANMLAGEMKMLLSSQGKDIRLSTPTIIGGEEYSIEVISNSGAIVVPFNRKEKRFLATVQLEP